MTTQKVKTTDRKLVINSFFKRNHETIKTNSEPSKAAPDQMPTINEMLRNGKINEYSDYTRQSMIFGSRPRLEDLTCIDRYKKISSKIDNLLQTRAEALRAQEEIREEKQPENTKDVKEHPAKPKQVEPKKPTEDAG